jgi:adenosyl cobinamide kinase/adenosyl cobinamide phosphate guanylyltransferase
MHGSFDARASARSYQAMLTRSPQWVARLVNPVAFVASGLRMALRDPVPFVRALFSRT